MGNQLVQNELNDLEDKTVAVSETSQSLEEHETDDDDFQVVERKRGKSKVLNNNQSSSIVTRNSLKAKGTQPIRSTVAKKSFKGGRGAPLLGDL